MNDELEKRIAAKIEELRKTQMRTVDEMERQAAIWAIMAEDLNQMTQAARKYRELAKNIKSINTHFPNLGKTAAAVLNPRTSLAAWFAALIRKLKGFFRKS